MTAYYNEIDPFAAQWLRNLIAAGHVAPGDVDERDIRDIRPSDLRGYAQCHFFAGIGVWSHALRAVGWPDDRPIWTGSCPCQPFSAAGRGGGVADERHLWPHFFHLIDQCRPVRCVGEQVASGDGLAWLDLVQSDLEGAGYASAAVDIGAAGVGAPHIRQRLYWMADAMCGGAVHNSRDGVGAQTATYRENGGLPGERLRIGEQSPSSGMADSVQPGRPERRAEPGDRSVAGGGGAGGVADPHGSGRFSGVAAPATARHGGSVVPDGGACGRAYPHDEGPQGRERGEQRTSRPGGVGSQGTPGPTNSFWRDADWLLCRDGKFRPVEPGTFPLAHGAPSRVGRLRAYGNALCAQTAIRFLGAMP